MVKMTKQNENYTTLMNQLSISAWNVHGLGEKIHDNSFREKINSEINILLETWSGSSMKYELPNYQSISKCRKKKKKSRRYSGGIIVYIKKNISCGISYLENSTQSENRLWLKLDKNVFGLENDIYIYVPYIYPLSHRLIISQTMDN